jgi:hypothetical protein
MTNLCDGFVIYLARCHETYPDVKVKSQIKYLYEEWIVRNACSILKQKVGTYGNEE